MLDHFDQHIKNIITFNPENVYKSIEVKEELVSFIKSMVYSKEQMDLMIESILSPLLYNYNSSQFSFAPYSVLKNVSNRICDVSSYKVYDNEYPEFKP
ncbi:MAG: hypothetical protein AB8U25_00695 [Rickettsiales endosymbiont of Dermacentor nuttalli]